MKKIISMGIASAVLALTAIAASADIKATSADKAVNGKTITVEVTTTADLETFGFTVSATGLETAKENVTPIATGTALANINAEGVVSVSGFNAGGWKAGDVLATITYTVTAETGADVTVAIGNMDGYDDVPVNFTTTVVAEGTDPTTPTDPADPENPPMGVALAVVPAVLAGAAVVVAKKRK